MNKTFLIGSVLSVLVWSAIHPHDRLTWLLEAFPVLIGGPLLWMTSTIFPLTPLSYGLLSIHAIILLVGGHYTYAEVPVGLWMQDTFDFSRNHYDRIGHVAQGFVPALVAREILLRRTPLVPGRWTFVLVTSVCLAFSASYELFEWATARITGESSTAFLGTQGDEWDTQWDMFLALVGAITSQIMLQRLHDRQLQQLT